MNLSKLAEEIVNGRRLTPKDDLSFFVTCDLSELTAGADYIRKQLVGDKVDLCTIINGKSGKCSENCKYCAQSAHYNTSCETYDLLSPEEILKEAKSNEKDGVDRFAVVISGHHPDNATFEKLIKVYETLKENCKLGLCASLGFLTSEQFRRLRAAGVSSYHNNIETSRRYFPYICTTHTFDDKIANIKRAQAEGLNVCSGGIIGMGETWADRIDMALALADLHIMSIPVNSLMAIKGTPLANQPRLTEDEILRTIAIFRYINPESHVRLAGGRALMKESGKVSFNSGASATITGNMLTTTASTIASDRAMLLNLGKQVI